MKTYEAIEVELHTSSTSSLDGGDCFTPPTPYPRTKGFRARWIGPKRVPRLNIHTTLTDTSSLHFITPVNLST
jgi:hypothetical protein